jgi:hypothetical protein
MSLEPKPDKTQRDLVERRELLRRRAALTECSGGANGRSTVPPGLMGGLASHWLAR